MTTETKIAAADNYAEYARIALAEYARRDAASRDALWQAVKERRVRRVLDVGCGAGQELLPFLERTSADCVGADLAPALGTVAGAVFRSSEYARRVHFVRAPGERLPFADRAFDVVLCRVALPYMNNQRALAEIARVLAPDGAFLLKTHAVAFYLRMIRERARTLSIKQIAYPLVCLAGGVWHSATGRQLEKGLWKGKEIYQTRRFLERELTKHNLRIEGELPDTNRRAPSYLIVKNSR